MISLSVFELSEGMILAEPILCQQTRKLLIASGTKLTDQLISTIKARGISSVCVAERFTLLVHPNDTTVKELKSLLEQEIVRLAPEKLEANKNDEMVKVSKLARTVVNKILEDQSLIDFCVWMKLIDNYYLYKHCIGTCALSLLVAGAMRLSFAEMVTIGSGALLHDLGLCEMPLLINDLKSIAKQEALWKEHPRYGYYFAREAGISDAISNLILQHHEEWDGGGYPNKIKGERISLGARIISVCETYDRLIRMEGYPHYQSIENLYGGGGYYFDPEVVQAFTNNIAVYPLGSMVRLSTSEVGIVVNVRDNYGPRPIVRVYFNRVNRPLTTPKDINLGKELTVFIKEVL